MTDYDWPPVTQPGSGIPHQMKEQDMPDLDDLDARPYGDLDLDDTAAIVAEIKATANNTSKYGIQGERPEDRIRDAARLGFLSARLVWLESARMGIRALDASTR